MVACSLLLIPASSWIYAAVAAPLGLWFLAMAHLLHARVLRGNPAKPMTLFHLSNLYLKEWDWKGALEATRRLADLEKDKIKKIAHLHRVAKIHEEGFKTYTERFGEAATAALRKYVAGIAEKKANLKGGLDP